MPFPFAFNTVAGELAVAVNMLLAQDGVSWTWLESSRSSPVRLRAADWPDGLAKSVDLRNQARSGQRKGRVLVVRHGPVGKPAALEPVAVLCWHAHDGNWPLTVLDCGYRLDLDSVVGKELIEAVLLGALADLNDRPELRDRRTPRPNDRLGWVVNHQAGAGSDRSWARAVATRAQREWGFAIVKPKSARPTWAQQGFYGERAR